MVVLVSMDMVTLVTLWTFTAICLALIIVRLVWRYRRAETFYRDDIWMGLSSILLVARAVLIHFSITYGTNTFNHALIPTLSQTEIDQRTIGSKLVLPGRLFYAAFVWCMKACLLYFLNRLTARVKPYGKIIDAMWGVLLVTFIIVTIITFVECQPFGLYYQVYPDPGKCALAQAQLITMGSLNIITDLALLIIPLPIILQSRLPLGRKIQVFSLFGATLIMVVVTILRMPLIIDSHQVQEFRSFWANVECLVACFVANVVTINAFFNSRRFNNCNQHDHYTFSPRNGKRSHRMPVTGQNSLGSLTRLDGGETGIEVRNHPPNALSRTMAKVARPMNGKTRTEILTKVHDDPELSAMRSQVMKSPWRGDFLGTSIWTPTELPEVPPRIKQKKHNKKEPRIEAFYPGIHDPRRPGDTVPVARLPDMIFDD